VAAGCPAHVHAAPASTAGPQLRIRIDRDLCQGHAVCAGEAPEVFAVSPKDHKVILKVARPPAELHEKVRNAAKYCPTRTIRIEEE
jgi:sterol 14-demethylase